RLEGEFGGRVAGGEAPPPLLGVPGDRRLEEVAVAIDDVRQRPRPRTEHESNLGLDPGDRPALGVPPRFLVEDTPAPTLDRVFEALRRERVRTIVRLGRVPDRGQRPTHGMRSEGPGNL